MSDAPKPHLVGSHKEPLNGLTCAADGRLVAASGYGRCVVWNPKGQQVGELGGNFGVCWQGALSSKGVVATGFGDQSLWLWNLKTAAQQKLPTLGGIIASFSWSKDGKRLMTGNCGDNHVRLWDAEAGTLIAQGKTKKSATWFVALSPDGKTGVSGAGDKFLHVWEIEKGLETAALAGHTGKILGLAYSLDGRRVASASQDKTARVWDMSTEQCIATLAGHKRQVVAIAMAPDGERVATASTDGTVRLWDVATGKEQLVIRTEKPPAAVAWGEALYVAAGTDVVAYAL